MTDSSPSPSAPPRTLRACVVTFLNARPLYHTLVDPKHMPRHADGTPMFSVEEALPADCAKALAAGECDLALAPVGAYVEHPEWEVVPGIGIGCRGPVETVVCCANAPIETVETIYLDAASRSSALLLRLLLHERGLDPELVRVEHGRGEGLARASEGKAAALIIGDAAFGMRDRFSHVWDLGGEWFRATGLPMVFAFWVARPGLVGPEHVAALQAARERSLGKYAEAIAKQYREELQARIEGGSAEPLLSEAHYARYLRKTIRYGLETKQREGLVEYLTRCRDAGLIEIPGLHPEDPIHVKFAGAAAPERLVAARARRSKPMDVAALLSAAAEGKRLDLAEGIYLLDNAPLMALGAAADRRRAALHPEGVVTYIIDRNVNYTNICVTRCKFCNFYVPPTDKTGRAYLLSKDELARKFRETEDLEGVQILLQGGLNPSLGLDYYEDLFRWTKANFDLRLHALSPTEIIHIAQLEDMSYTQVLERLLAAGMDSLPGGGAEILDDEVRNRISPFKNSTDEWLGVMRAAHGLGMRSTATMVFGFQETAEHLLMHLDRLRSLQDDTGGFTAFITWPFQADGTRLKLRDDTSAFRYLRIQALARLYLDNIPNIQVSWPTLGPEIGEIALRFGANDFGSVMIEENVVSQAGARFMMTAEEIERHIRLAGFEARRRTMAYELLPLAG
ncbi:dehypoxanthine futalosine cyclase [Pseudenhygromyxa sp. WMMC2535]|uniref:cyclic dehypoxanthinyl futalosine synthase n=1 Tax=Pseudenhygromyxa sp. WMMC2535 TaxID=2712867 RepID=UPI001555CABE|nr:cyclic dehypoxanthinyl futalosine synthase [Pseudenhygromyxa sp. WMMC2535]NVB41797.1 dehypoxanthine futalosine cyclase [Pseudenhygromyxa sp. WMMC2535]